MLIIGYCIHDMGSVKNASVTKNAENNNKKDKCV